MDQAYKADPRFDPVRNARELGLRSVPLAFLGGSDSAGSTDATTTSRPDYASRIPWVRVAGVALIVWLIWKLGK